MKLDLDKAIKEINAIMIKTGISRFERADTVGMCSCINVKDSRSEWGNCVVGSQE